MSENYREQMEARGWAWDDELRAYCANGGRNGAGQPIIGLRVSRWRDGGWYADYGMPGVRYGLLTTYDTPMEAADVAEAWLREVLAPLRLPWLSVTPGGAR